MKLIVENACNADETVKLLMKTAENPHLFLSCAAACHLAARIKHEAVMLRPGGTVNRARNQRALNHGHRLIVQFPREMMKFNAAMALKQSLQISAFSL